MDCKFQDSCLMDEHQSPWRSFTRQCWLTFYIYFISLHDKELLIQPAQSLSMYLDILNG